MTLIGGLLVACLVISCIHLIAFGTVYTVPKVSAKQKQKVTNLLASLSKQDLITLANSLPK